MPAAGKVPKTLEAEVKQSLDNIVAGVVLSAFGGPIIMSAVPAPPNRTARAVRCR